MFVAAAMMLLFHVPIVHQSMNARSPMPCLKRSGMSDVHDMDIRLVIPCLYMIQAFVPWKLRGHMFNLLVRNITYLTITCVHLGFSATVTVLARPCHAWHRGSYLNLTFLSFLLCVLPFSEGNCVGRDQRVCPRAFFAALRHVFVYWKNIDIALRSCVQYRINN